MLLVEQTEQVNTSRSSFSRSPGVSMKFRLEKGLIHLECDNKPPCSFMGLISRLINFSPEIRSEILDNYSRVCSEPFHDTSDKNQC